MKLLTNSIIVQFLIPNFSPTNILQSSFFRAVFKFEGNNLNVTATGKDFKDFKSAFTNDDRGFGYIRISVSR